MTKSISIFIGSLMVIAWVLIFIYWLVNRDPMWGWKILAISIFFVPFFLGFIKSIFDIKAELDIDLNRIQIIPDIDFSKWYWVGYKISWVPIFIGSWAYCITSYGYLLGVGLGWLPSLIVASFASFLWPLSIMALVVFCFLIFRG